MSKRKKILLIGGGILFSLYLLSSIFSNGTEIPTVKTAKATISDITEKVSASGKIQPEMEVNISAEVSGQLIQLPVKEGDRVQAGDLLAEINPDLYIAAVNRAQAAVNTSRSNLSSSKAAKATSKANLFVAEQAWTRTQSLFSQGVISQADYDQSEAAYKTASANLTSASEGVKSASFAILSAEASLQEAQDNLSRTKLIAPQAGIVTALVKEIGESVQGNGFTAGEIIMKISNLDLMEVDVEVNESDIISVSMGNEAEIEVDAYLGHTFRGIVSEIGNTALNASSNGFNLDQVTNFSVKIRIDSNSYNGVLDSGAPFRPGMSATVDILTESASDVMSLPIQCVTTRNDSLGVFVLEGSTAVWTSVEVGIQDNQNIEIKSGVNENDIVISGPYDMVARKLNNGDVVLSSDQGSKSDEDKTIGFSVSING
ncbi:MAG: efflux transporter periplasmic adaptor subunit [Euryarchaeota archaeon]|nr:efflux transporter periplasmic adaptor subunit [Euryarchaeota archaeon]|tara:strand:- start:2749 stop:4035 length:1287 start_codon:yes stop_codon:yes gene_type:complete